MMTVSKAEFLARTQLEQETVELWVREEWLVPLQVDAEAAFTEADIARAKLIQDLTADLGVNAEGVGIVLHLLDQVHGLRRTIADMLQSARDRSAERGLGPS